jgi:mannose-6-phosphate isomerase-like protein (cupin superfamily)
MAMARRFRRVVTGHDAAGKAVVLSDGPAPNPRGHDEFGVDVTDLWLAPRTPADNRDATDRAVGDLPIQPPPGGTIFRIVEFRPGETRALAGWRPGPGGDNRTHPFMHRTATVDYQVVLKGEIVMLLDNSEVTLREGDVVVQRGTNHAWVNRGKEPCFLVAVQVDAQPL